MTRIGLLDMVVAKVVRVTTLASSNHKKQWLL